MSNCVNVTEVTTIAGCVAGLGVIALTASGWRQPARVEPSSPRGLSGRLRQRLDALLRRPAASDDDGSTPTPTVDSTSVYPTPWWRRARSVAGGTGLALWSGAVAATVVGFAAALVVISLTSMLKR